MKLKRLFIGFLSAIFLSASFVPVYAEALKPVEIFECGTAPTGEQQKVYFSSFTGIVQQVTEAEGGLKYVLVKNSEGQEANLVISEETYRLDNAEITKGAEVTGFYDPNLPMIMIYPPQYKTEVIVVSKEGQNVKVDFFNEDLVSADGLLKLNLSKETQMILEDGSKYEGELGNKKLAVIYSTATKSIPAQTTPSKIVVLCGEENDGAVQTFGEILVNKKNIEAPPAYADTKGTPMIPLRAAAEALGFKVNWEGKGQKINLNQNVFLTIGEAACVLGNKRTAKLEAVPVLNDGVTFVPLSFFKEAAGADNAYIIDEKVIIEDIK